VTSAVTFLQLDLEKLLILFLCNKLHERIHPAPLQGTWENIQLYLYFRLQHWQNWFKTPPPWQATIRSMQANQSLISSYKHIFKPDSIGKQKQLHKQLIRMVTKEYHPFRILNSWFVQILYPGYQIPSRKTLTV
jgi:hypothetical protein